jgi:uncharacterized membrane protein
MKNNYWEVVLGSILIIFGILLVNPGMFWMPTALLMTAVAAFAVVFFLFAGFVWKESARDEREDLHRFVAGRTGFLVGAGTLALGIIVQSFTHTIDPWLVTALTLMVVAKLLSRAFLM